MPRCHFLKVLLLGLCLSWPLSAAAQLQPAALVQDGMVLQRHADVPIWGRGDPGTEVTVTFKGERHTATVDASGAWRVHLSPGSAGGPHDLAIEGGGEAIRVQDVLVGDVWLCSGQSNMEWRVTDSKNAEQEIARADDRRIRHFKVPRSWANAPADRLAGGEWHPALSEHVGDFTAVGYFFARELRPHVDVPIGLINSSWGGSRIEPWISASALGLTSADSGTALQPRYRQVLRHLDSLRRTIEDFEAVVGRDPDDDLGRSNGPSHWATPDRADESWRTIPVSGPWEDAGYPGLDGVAWYRTPFRLSAQEAQSPVQLHLGRIGDEDITWVNGTEVGRTQAAGAERVYTLPDSVLTAGENVLAIRVRDHGGPGGFRDSPEPPSLVLDGTRRPLSGPWRFRVGAVSTAMNHVPTVLYNKMIHPLLPFPITGALWYQGESNATPESAYNYRSHFKTLIRSWREEWDRGPFPFLFVQLANFEPDPPYQGHWPVLRESQSAALSLPKTAQAVTIDIGNPDDIHPRNKQDVGRRLARAARALTYGEELVYSGPRYETHRVEDDRIVLEFSHEGDGLTAKGDSLHGFTIAGSDRRFVPARAEIEGDRVVVQSDRVEEPVAVRYAWNDNPASANLSNQAGLPAPPFRTDTWPLE